MYGTILTSGGANPMSEKKEKQYRIKNWAEYNKGLCKRGSLMLFLDAGVLETGKKIDPKKKVVGGKNVSGYNYAMLPTNKKSISFKVTSGTRVL
jgi:hypothetical protein